MDSDISDSVKIETSDAEKKPDNLTTESKPQVNQRDKKHAKDEKPRKKEERGVEQILKSLGNIENADEKLSAICMKYSEVIDENRKLQLALKQTEKKVQMRQREKEQLQTERSKAVLTRSRLESLCRELQRQNKAVKEESLLKIREEEEKRKELSAKFQSTLGEITALMNQNNEKNAKLHEDNMEMSKTFKSVCEQAELREQQLEKFQQQMKLQVQLLEAKMAKVTLEMTAERETLLNEKKELLSKLTEYQVRIKAMQAQEVDLRSQISMYTDKYDEFQNALTKSNEVFGGFNEEMEKMSKKIQKLEKETGLWKQRWEKSHQALLEMAADKQARDAEIKAINRKRLLLIELCKAFQEERKTLMTQLKEKVDEEPNDAQNKTSDEINEPIEKTGNLTKDFESLSDSLSQAQESLMQDIEMHEARNRGQNVKSKGEEASGKTESSKRKEKKRQGKGNEKVVKTELGEKGLKNEQIVKLNDKIIELETSDKTESADQNENVVDKDEEPKDKDEKLTEKEEIQEKVINEGPTSVETEDLPNPSNSGTDNDSKQMNNSEKLESKENLNETSVSNLDTSVNETPDQLLEVQVPLETKTEDIVEDETKTENLTEELEQPSENLETISLNDVTQKKDDKSINNSNQNEENIEETEFNTVKSELVLENANENDVQMKSDACPTSVRKGKEAKKKKK